MVYYSTVSRLGPGSEFRRNATASRESPAFGSDGHIINCAETRGTNQRCERIPDRIGCWTHKLIKTSVCSTT